MQGNHFKGVSYKIGGSEQPPGRKSDKTFRGRPSWEKETVFETNSLCGNRRVQLTTRWIYNSVEKYHTRKICETQNTNQGFLGRSNGCYKHKERWSSYTPKGEDPVWRRQLSRTTSIWGRNKLTGKIIITGLSNNNKEWQTEGDCLRTRGGGLHLTTRFKRRSITLSRSITHWWETPQETKGIHDKTKERGVLRHLFTPATGGRRWGERTKHELHECIKQFLKRQSHHLARCPN